MHVESFSDVLSGGLGRYIIVGDVLEIPFLQQDGYKAYWEVLDVDRKQEFENFYVIIKARPLTDSREVAEIPDKNSNADVMAGIQTDLDTEANAQVQDEGLDTSEVVVDDPQAGDSYDSRNDAQRSLLDDPSRKF